MTTNRRKSNRHYIGAPWARGSGSQKRDKNAKTKVSKKIAEDRRSFVLPLVVRPDGRWGYKFGRMRKRLTDA